MLKIVGIVGVPSKYGGFETLVDNLLDSVGLRRLGTVVFCERHVIDEQGPIYKGARLEPLIWRANGWQSVLFDSWGLWKSSRNGGVVLVLGTSATFWLPILRLLFPRARYVVNMAGLEWARSKWGRLARCYLKYNEGIAARHAHVFIADNQGLVDYVRAAYGRDAVLITYGGDQFEQTVPDKIVFEAYELPDQYDFAMARAQIDNNVEMILDAYAASGLPLVFVSNWDSSKFGRDVRERYAGFENMHLIGPVYDAAKVKALHQRARVYVHGHSAGGTNPVLVEAMWAGLPTLAFDVQFNRHTTDGKAFYFSSVSDLILLSKGLDSQILAASKLELRALAVRHYKWEEIRKSYEKIIFSIAH
jgi:glycosyltransferase involved in cell wall biosynthesis